VNFTETVSLFILADFGIAVNVSKIKGFTSFCLFPRQVLGGQCSIQLSYTHIWCKFDVFIENGELSVYLGFVGVCSKWKLSVI